MRRRTKRLFCISNFKSFFFTFLETEVSRVMADFEVCIPNILNSRISHEHKLDFVNYRRRF